MRTPDDPRTPTRGFGRVSAEHAQTFIGIINVLHNGPTAPAFGRLLQKKLEADDYMMLAHIFEEFCVMALHHLIPEALLFDAFAFDLYWDELREDVLALRQETGNEKFCENFEIAAERAREYRQDRPPKLRWRSADSAEGRSDTEGGQGVRPRRRSPHGPPPKSDRQPTRVT